MSNENEKARKKLRKGFAAMAPEKQAQIAAKGGRIAHANGNAHEFTPEEGRRAGAIGGRTISENREYMAEIGRRGGLSRGVQKRLARAAKAEKAAKEEKVEGVDKSAKGGST